MFSHYYSQIEQFSSLYHATSHHEGFAYVVLFAWNVPSFPLHLVNSYLRSQFNCHVLRETFLEVREQALNNHLLNKSLPSIQKHIGQ